MQTVYKRTPTPTIIQMKNLIIKYLFKISIKGLARNYSNYNKLYELVLHQSLASLNNYINNNVGVRRSF